MPFHPSMKALYPPDWTQISHHIHFGRARGRCEWCRAVHGQPHPETGSKVILTTAHLDHNPANNSESNLAALCYLSSLLAGQRQFLGIDDRSQLLKWQRG